jgi:hypothetical protein
MLARLRDKITHFELILSKRQPDFFILHHSDCSSLLSDKLNDEKYVKVQNIAEAKKIAKMDNKPIISCAICCE